VAPSRFDLTYHLPAPPEQVWPILADTERLNRQIGLPPTRPEPLGKEPARLARVRAAFAGIPLEWIEEPFEFVEPRYYWVRRVMCGGPLREFNGGARFKVVPGGTEVRVESEFVPANAVGRTLIGAVWAKTRRDFDRLIRGVRAHLEGEHEHPYARGIDLAPSGVSERTRERLQVAARDLPAGPLTERLVEHLSTAGELDLARMRPFALAAAWGEERYDVLRLCLRAARAGVLNLSWDLLCPNCRGAKGRWHSLDQVRDQAHCDDCQIQFDADFDRAVEVTFRPHARIRLVEPLVYCSGGPRNTPHVVAQKLLAPAEVWELDLPLREGRYRLRDLRASRASWLYVEHDGESSARASFATELGLDPPEGVLRAGEVRLEIENRSGERMQALLERVGLHEECATAAAVSVFQEFRDLFGKEVLSPSTQLGIETLPLMFTDLKGSTALYTTLGDAPAYALVRDHFQLLRDLVARHGGGIIKTIGDAVMAAFPTAEAALSAALEIHADLARFNEHALSPVSLKVGVHQGPCIAVRSYDERLDYFGSAVNLAARTHEQSRGDDIVVTEAILRDPGAAALLRGVRQEPFTADLRGLGEVRLHRLIP
jgi:adenylate cyclase